MDAGPELRTERLLLRRWRDGDRAPFAVMNADSEVREFFRGLETREESDASVDRFDRGFEEHGFGLWAVEVVDSGEFIGFTGLSVPSFEAHFTPAVEVGWRLARAAWGHGFATEAARAALWFGFERVGLDEIVSFTPADHVRSQAVMRRIGMSHDPADDFDHPRIARGDRLCRHILYRITADSWRSSTRR